MRREDLFDAFGMVEESRLAQCEKYRNPSVVTHREVSKMNNGGKYCKQTKRSGLPKVWLIAAIIAAMVFLMGCAWVIIEIAGSPLFDYPLTESADVDTERIHLTVSDVTVTSMNVTCSIDGVEPNQEAIYILRNGPYTIEKQTDNGWEELAVKIQDPQWDADEIITDGSTDWRVDWTALYGILEPGVYRFTTTVLEGNVPVSTTFTVEEAAGQNEFGDELAILAAEILDRDYFYVRFYEKYEFGSFDKLTDDQRNFLESEYDTYLVHEYLKYGNDMLTLTYKGDHTWMGQMYKDGSKYSLEHENDNRTNAVIGWSPWPEMDMENLTWWVGMLANPDKEWVPQYAADGSLEKITYTVHSDKFQDNYDVEVDHIQVFEFVNADPAEIAKQIGEQDVNTARTFSWEEDRKNMKALDVTFVNTTAKPVSNASDAIERAMAECTVEHDKIIIYRDEEAGMWKVEFQIMYGYQGYQYIYLNDDGITQMVSGAGSKVPEWQDQYPNP